MNLGRSPLPFFEGGGEARGNANYMPSLHTNTTSCFHRPCKPVIPETNKEAEKGCKKLIFKMPPKLVFKTGTQTL